jgi:hypothetical protein
MKAKRIKTQAEKMQPRPPEVLRKGGAMRSKVSYTRKPKHKGLSPYA